ncbi:N-acyl-D-aspartate deacylase-like [Bradysia coprophila]|uniref:N-acyl-D-aspartate deacylase-like n=1 Tax=Bradysia coprophila TaxID=38358 RepID=UPI00187D7D2E|nr:N-acyl-D-aspartate deacylase-like [Bradysia coprophila]
MAQQQYDTIIVNARIIDGTGAPWYRSSLAIKGDKIAKIGTFSEDELSLASNVFNASDSYLAPGFIDSHTHDDSAIISAPEHESKTRQGVTTVVTGNCGFSTYPNGDIEEIRSHLRTLLGNVPEEHFFSNFTSLKDSLTANIGLNIASLVGHGPLRISVMGYEQREATTEEISAMSELLEEQLQQGAIGMSLGLVYPPSAYAGIEELVTLAKVVAKYDRLLSAHVRSYEGSLLKSIDEFLNILKESKARGLLSHLQAAGRPYWEILIPQAIDMIESARQEQGIDIAVDMYPYLAGSSTILQLLPPSAMAGGFQELLRKIEDPIYREELRELTESGREPGWESKIALIGWENVVISSVIDESLRQFEGMNMTAAAQVLDMSEFDFLLYVVVIDEGTTNIIMFQQSEVDLHKVLRSRLHMIGSDSIPRDGGKPHPRMYGSFPKVIGRLANQDGLMALEEAVRKATSLPAQRFGILDRGILRPQMIADIVLFSPDFVDNATFEEPTLSPKGLQSLWINGIQTILDDKPLGTLAGNVIVK